MTEKYRQLDEMYGTWEIWDVNGYVEIRAMDDDDRMRVAGTGATDAEAIDAAIALARELGR